MTGGELASTANGDKDNELNLWSWIATLLSSYSEILSSIAVRLVKHTHIKSLFRSMSWPIKSRVRCKFITQLQDRIAIRELIDAYSFCADTRNIQGHMALFTGDTNFEVYMDEKISTPTQVVTGRKNLFPVFDDLNQYIPTMHLNAQSTINVNGDHATATTYCRAYHLKLPDGVQKVMIAGIRYYDTLVKQDGAWLFAERRL
jgi:hypothetical protein